MYAIKMETDHSLTTTVHSTIYQGDKNDDTLVFVIPQAVDEVNMANCTVLLRYILPNGTGRSEELMMYPIPHNRDYLQFRLSVSSRFTEQPGHIELWLTAVNFNDDVVFHTGTAEIEITQHINIDDYMPPESLDQLDKLSERVNRLESGRVNNLRYDEENDTLQLLANGVPVGDCIDVSGWENKADNIVFHEEDSTIQLTANGEPIGERIFVSTRTGKLVKAMAISSNGNLIVTYDDGTVENLGHVVGKDGAVYIPNVDERKVLSFTIGDKPGAIPDPVDLNPGGEWSGISGNPTMADTDYVWGKI